MRIYKYEIKPYDSSDDAGEGVRMPQGALLLHVGMQSVPGTLAEGVYAWALVDPDAPMVFRRLLVLGTGHDVPIFGRFSADDYVERYVGSVHYVSASLTFHIFDFGEPLADGS